MEKIMEDIALTMINYICPFLFCALLLTVYYGMCMVVVDLIAAFFRRRK